MCRLKLFSSCFSSNVKGDKILLIFEQINVAKLLIGAWWDHCLLAQFYDYLITEKYGKLS